MKKICFMITTTLISASIISGCQSIDNILTDSEMRQESTQDVVVNPVPRTQIKAENNTVKSSSIPTSPLTTTNKSQPTFVAPASSQPTKGQKVVPNVAPSLGE